MATEARIVATPSQPVAAATATTSYTDFAARGRTLKNNAPLGNQTFLFDRSNWMWIGIGLAFILLGLFLMAGGKSPNPNEFHPEVVYSARRITVAPLMMLIGFAIEAYAIMKKPAAAKVEG